MKTNFLQVFLIVLLLGMSSISSFYTSVDAQDADRDRDGIADHVDACPDQAGTLDLFGCASAGQAPDRDGDSVPDLFDACPDQAGDPLLSGCVDSDGDFVIDSMDACPTEAGDPQLGGCNTILEVELPLDREVIHPQNAGTLQEYAQMRLVAPRFSVGGTRLAVRTGGELYTYDLAQPTLLPQLALIVGSSGYPVAINPHGDEVATIRLPADYSTPPYVQIDHAVSAEMLNRLRMSEDFNAPMVSDIAYSPANSSLLAVAYNSGMLNDQPTLLQLWSADGSAQLRDLFHTSGVFNMAFSGDGLYLASTMIDNGAFYGVIWETATGAEITRINLTNTITPLGVPLALNRDGSQLAVGLPNGEWVAYAITQGTAVETSRVALFNDPQKSMTALAYHPSDDLLAIAWGTASLGTPTHELSSIVLVDTATTQALMQREDAVGAVHDLAFSADGTLLISAGQSQLRFWGAP